MQDDFHPHGVGLLVREAVAAVDGAEVVAEAESVEDVGTEARRFVSEHGQDAVVGSQRGQRVLHAGVSGGGIEHMGAVVVDEELQAALHSLLIGRFAEGAPDEHLGAVADVAIDLLIRERGQGKLGAGGVD